jgi:hypothetical protein
MSDGREIPFVARTIIIQTPSIVKSAFDGCIFNDKLLQVQVNSGKIAVFSSC